GADTTTQRATQDLERLRWHDQPVRGQFRFLERDPGQLVVLEDPAVEEEPHAARITAAWSEKVHRHQAAVRHVEPDLFAHLATTALPRRLAVRLHDPARNRPVLLV